MSAVEISVVVPVYGCRDCLSALHDRLVTTLEAMGEDFELIFVDDRSPDGAWTVLAQLADADDRVRALRLSRNFGQHVAITAGLATARGRWTVVMDCDLQDPPEEIPRLYAKAQEGFDMVLSRRQARVQSLPRRVAAAAYFRVYNALVKDDLHNNYSNLSLLSRKVVDAFLTLRDRDRQFLLILHWLGFERAEIDLRQSERHAGRSSYTFRQLLNVAVDGLFFQSTVLLRWIVYAGFCLAALGIGLGGYSVIALLAGSELPRWTGLSMLALFLASFIVISTGVSGLYVGKIFEQVKGRPLYVVDEVAGETPAAVAAASVTRRPE